MPPLRFLFAVALIATVPAAVIAGALYLDRHGDVAPGTVVARHETIHAHLGRTLAVQVAYEPREYSARARFINGGPLRPWISVGAATYDRLHVGDRVDVRYLPLFPTIAVLARPSTLAQLPWHLVAALALLVGVVFRCATRPGVPPLLIGAVAVWTLMSDPAPDAPSTLATVAALAGGVLACAWVGAHGERWLGPGAARMARLLVQGASLAVLAAVVAPHGGAFGSVFGAGTQRGTAVVRALQSFEVDGSENVPFLQPFTLVQLDLVPAGLRDTVVAADIIDRGSVTALRVGARLAVDVPVGAPRRATLVDGTRSYKWKNSLLALLAGAAWWLLAAARRATAATRRWRAAGEYISALQQEL